MRTVVQNANKKPSKNFLKSFITTSVQPGQNSGLATGCRETSKRLFQNRKNKKALKFKIFFGKTANISWPMLYFNNHLVLSLVMQKWAVAQFNTENGPKNLNIFLNLAAKCRICKFCASTRKFVYCRFRLHWTWKMSINWFATKRKIK